LKVFPVAQIIRPSIPLITTPGPNRTTGLGDITLFDLLVPERVSWGSLGIGPVAVFPSATDNQLGSEKWQIGPAGAFIYEAIPHLQLGFIIQNPISIGGNADRDDVNQLLLQPIAQYNFEQGWYASIGDFTWSFDWEDDGDAMIPLALQLGRVMTLNGSIWNFAVEPFYVVTNDPGPRWGFRFGVSLLLPEK
jgi:hypothetical protein